MKLEQRERAAYESLSLSLFPLGRGHAFDMAQKLNLSLFSPLSPSLPLSFKRGDGDGGGRGSRGVEITHFEVLRYGAQPSQLHSLCLLVLLQK
jgi:hypothetical protein